MRHGVESAMFLSSRQDLLLYFLSVTLILLLAITLYNYRIDSEVVQVLLVRVDALGWFGLIFLGLFYGLLALLPIPLMPLTAVGGYAMGFWTGLAVLWPAAIISSVLSHWIGALFFTNQLNWLLERFPKARILSEAAAETGWRAVAANRLLPVCPFAVQNVLLGAIGVRKRDQAVGTAVGILPALCLALYCGSIGKVLAEVLLNPQGAIPIARVGLMVMSVLVFVAVFIWSRRVLGRSISSSRAGAEQDG